MKLCHHEKLNKFENKLKQIQGLTSKSISPGEAWILCREESSILAQFHQPEEVQKAVQFCNEDESPEKTKVYDEQNEPHENLKVHDDQKNDFEGKTKQKFGEPSMSPKIGMLCRLSSNEEESPEKTKEHEELNEVQEMQKVHDEENNDNDFDFHGRTRQK